MTNEETLKEKLNLILDEQKAKVDRLLEYYKLQLEVSFTAKAKKEYSPLARYNRFDELTTQLKNDLWSATYGCRDTAEKLELTIEGINTESE